MAELAIPVALALVEKVIIFLHQKFHRKSSVEDDLEKAQNCLRRMEAYLGDSSEHIDEGSTSHHNQTRLTRVREVQDLAYEIVDALDKFMLQVPHHIHSNIFSQKMHDFAHFLPNWRASKELSSEINGIIEKKISLITLLDGISDQAPAHSRPSSRTGLNPHNHVLEEEEIVGFEELEEILFGQLMEGDSRLLTILIQGPGGSGKSTLAKNVYSSKRVQGFFDCQAWVDMPRPFVLNELLLNILSKFEAKGQKEPVLHGENNPKAKLKLLLQQKRFVVVLDNVWSRGDLKCIVDALPDGSNGSRIIITTPKSDVASSLSTELYVHNLSTGLPWKKAKYLFCKKVFQSSEGSCPLELEEWAQKNLEEV